MVNKKRRQQESDHPYVMHHLHLRKDYRERLDNLRDKIVPGTVLTRTQVLEHIINTYIDTLAELDEGEEDNGMA